MLDGSLKLLKRLFFRHLLAAEWTSCHRQFAFFKVTRFDDQVRIEQIDVNRLTAERELFDVGDVRTGRLIKRKITVLDPADEIIER